MLTEGKGNVAVAETKQGTRRRPQLLLSGFAALAESVWMGTPQASDVLEVLNLVRSRWRPMRPQRPRLQLARLLTRELSIAEASFVLMASFFFSALLGAVRQVLFNSQFGAGAEASAYYAAARLPDALFSLIAGGALSSAMIPVLLSTRRDDGTAAAGRLTSRVLTVLLAAFAVLVVVGEILAPDFVTRVLAPGFDDSRSQLTVALTRLMLVQPVILAVGSVATAVLNSRNQFVLTALSVASHNLGLIGGIGASIVHPALGIYGPALGVIAGALLQVLILLPGLFGSEFSFRLSWDLGDRRLGEVVRLLIPNGLAVGVGYTGFIVDTAFASRTAEVAALAALQNAFMLVGLPIALLGQAVGQSAFPRLAAHAAAAEWSKLRRTLLRALAAVLLLALPTALGLILFGRIAIHILFEHGRFDPAAGALTYSVLGVYAIGLPAYVATEVFTRGLIALRDTRSPLLTNTVQLLGRIGLMTLLLPAVGVLSIPAAFAATAAAEAVVLGLILLLKLQRRSRASLQPV
jgi:putative peptidoglycan lipid II flippase